MNPIIKTACLEFEKKLAAALDTCTRKKLQNDDGSFATATQTKSPGK